MAHNLNEDSSKGLKQCNSLDEKACFNHGLYINDLDLARTAIMALVREQLIGRCCANVPRQAHLA
jgi:hypothetical protein